MEDPRTESVLSSLKVKFEYVAEFPLSKLVLDQETQVRFEDNQATGPEVKRYWDLLKGGAEFPPIVIMKNGRVIDGNTRWAAFDRQHTSRIPAYICEITSPALAKRIGAELNTVHGRRMEKAELASWLSSGNGSVGEEDALRITGWSATTVKRVRDAQLFEARRTKLGVSLTSSLPDTVKQALNKVTDPEAFRQLTLLADEAGLKKSEINQVSKQVNEAALTDAAAARRLIDDLRAGSGQRIEERRAGLRVTTPLYRQLAMHLGWVTGKGPSGLYDANPYTGPKSRALLEEAQNVIREAVERY